MPAACHPVGQRSWLVIILRVSCVVRSTSVVESSTKQLNRFLSNHTAKINVKLIKQVKDVYRGQGVKVLLHRPAESTLVVKSQMLKTLTPRVPGPRLAKSKNQKHNSVTDWLKKSLLT